MLKSILGLGLKIVIQKTSVQMDLKKKDFDIQYVTFLWNKKSLNEKQGCIS